MEPFYCRAEELFHVHGDLGSAPSVPGVTRLLTNSTGTAVTAVEVVQSGAGAASRDGNPATYRAGFFAVCAGAINSAVILLASANDKYPTGLANRSDQVGRNFMYHQADALLALGPERNEDSYA